MARYRHVKTCSLKVRMMINWTTIALKLNCVENQRQQSPIFMNLKLNGNLEKFLLFISNFNMNLEVMVTLVANAKVQCPYTLLHVEL